MFTVALFCGIIYFRGGTMDKSDKLELVVKSNDLIRKTRYSLSEQEQKIISIMRGGCRETPSHSTERSCMKEIQMDSMLRTDSISQILSGLKSI